MPGAGDDWTEPGGVQDVALPQPNRAGEPSIAVDPRTGAAYVVALAGGNNSNVFWRSLDKGHTWENLGYIASERGSGDGDVSVGPDGLVWVVTLWNEFLTAGFLDGPWCLTVAVSRDQGSSWSTNPEACQIKTYNERPWIQAVQGGAIIVHGCVSAGAWCLSSTTDNKVWTTWPLPSSVGGIVSRPVWKTDGSVAVAFAPVAGALRYFGPSVARTTDLGKTWLIEPVAQQTIDARFLQMAASRDQEVVAWSHEEAEGGLSIQASLRTGATWSSPKAVSGRGTAGMPWATGGASGLSIVWLSAPVAAHPHQVPADTPWNLTLWNNGTIRETGLTAHRGPLGTGYALHRGFVRSGLGDFISAARLDGGTTLIAYGNDLEGSGGFSEATIRVARVPSP